jgi:hypothetical protein
LRWKGLASFIWKTKLRSDGAMQPPEIIVKEAFAIPGRGAGVRPEQGLPPQLFGLTFDLELIAPDGSRRRAKGVVESLLLGTSPPWEVFTYVLHETAASEIPPGTILRMSIPPGDP